MAERLIGMLIFPRLTQLDMTGPYEVLARLPNTKVHLVAHTMAPVKTDRGMEIVPTVTIADCPQLDLVMVPGGPGQQDLMEDEVVLEFLQEAGGGREIRHVGLHRLAGAWAPQVCSRASARPAIGPRSTISRPLGAIPVSQRVVMDGNIITGAGVASGIDFALAVAAILEGEEVARQIQLQIEYDPSPPFDSGSTETASAETVALLRSRWRGAQRAAARGGGARRRKLGVPQ